MDVFRHYSIFLKILVTGIGFLTFSGGKKFLNSQVRRILLALIFGTFMRAAFQHFQTTFTLKQVLSFSPLPTLDTTFVTL